MTARPGRLSIAGPPAETDFSGAPPLPACSGNSPSYRDTGDFQRLASVGTESVVAAGQTLIERDHPGIGLYIVVDGTVVVEAPEGTRELGPGSLLGERALLSPHGVRTARVRAATEVRVLTVDRAKFEELCADDPGLAERLRS
jgi:CRP-like cAMP-binding protein